MNVVNANTHSANQPQTGANTPTPSWQLPSNFVGIAGILVLLCILGFAGLVGINSAFGPFWQTNTAVANNVDQDEPDLLPTPTLAPTQESNSVAKDDAGDAAKDDAAEEDVEASVDWTDALDSQELPEFWDAIFFLDSIDGKFTLVPASQVGAPSVIWGTLPETELVLDHVTPLRCEVPGGRTCIWRVDSAFSLPPEVQGGQAIGSNLNIVP